MKIVVAREGRVRLISQHDELIVCGGDAVTIPAQTEFQIIPVSSSHLTCIFIDPEYAVDLVYWQYRSYLTDRTDARVLAERLYSGIHLLIPLGHHLRLLEPALNRMIALSRLHDFSSHSNQIQGLWFTVAHTLSLCGGRLWPTPANLQQAPTPLAEPTLLRSEVLQVTQLLEQQPERRWTLQELAEVVHLSPNHLAAICSRAWGHTPRVRLTLIRIERLAHYLRETSIPVKQCVRLVGWQNHAHAVRIFRSRMGLAPSEYRLACISYGSETSGYRSHGDGLRSTYKQASEL